MSSTSTTSATTSFKSGSINISGLGNGTDFNSLVDGLITAESATKTQMENWKATWKLKVEGFQYLNTKLLNLKTTLSGMDTVNEFLTKAVSTSSSSAVTASATSDAQTGSHTVVVGQLAQTDILTTASGVSSLTSTVTTATSNLTFSYAGTSYTVSNVAGGLSLSSLVNLINNNSVCNGKIRATTIFDGTVYHLQLYGMDQGANNQVVLSNTGALVFGVSSFQNTQQAQSCLIKVDGYPSGAASWIARDSNTVSDVVPGLTLTLKQANSNAAIQVGVTTDTAGIKANIEAFIAGINDIRKSIKALTLVSNSSGTAKGSLLTGNYGVQIIASKLKDMVAEMGLGFTVFDSTANTGDYYSSLAQLGISTDADESSNTNGLLLLDSDKLAAALTKDPDGVAKLFSANYEGKSDSQDFSYLAHISGRTKAGSYDVQIITSAAGISSATVNGVAAGIDGWKVTALSGDAAGLVIQLDNQLANQTFTGKVNLKLGKAGEMVEGLKALTSSSDGPLAILEDNYGEIMTNIDDKIARETKRLATLKSTLQAKYARLDSLLNTLTNTQTQLSSTITQLSKD